MIKKNIITTVLLSIICSMINVAYCQKKDSIKPEISIRDHVFNETGVNIPTKMSSQHVRIMYNESLKHGIPLSILVKLIKVESNFSPVAKNDSGARGYMQLMPSTYNKYSKILKLEKTQSNNIIVGSFYLKEMYNLWNKKIYDERTKWRLALAAYNAGEVRVLKYNKVPVYTKKFVNSILK